jgi:hypothetical protein
MYSENSKRIHCPHKPFTLNWNETMPTDQLKTIFTKNFRAVHGTQLTWAPKPLTREWVIDQLAALDWYPVGFELTPVVVEKIKKERKVKDPNAPKVKRKPRKVKVDSPFGDET